VRSLPRRLADGRDHGGGLLAQFRDKDGYWCVHLRDAGRELSVPVHVLVASHFPCWEGLEVRHLGGQGDNHWTKLRWGTHRENERDKCSFPEPLLTVRSGEGGVNGDEGERRETEKPVIGIIGSRPFPAVTTCYAPAAERDGA
jgi:hypothetical protein